MNRGGHRHPKLFALAAALQIELPHALGCLELLWDFARDHSIQGDIGKWPNGAIASASSWKGNADSFVLALINTGWLEQHEDPKVRLLLHHWEQHAPRWVKLKMEKLKLSFIPSATGASIEGSTLTLPLTVPLSLTPSGGSPAPVGAELTVPVKVMGWIRVTAVKGRDVQSPMNRQLDDDDHPGRKIWEHAVTDREVQDWQETFPNVDVLQELREIKRWSKDNPAKTLQGFNRFVSRWLAKEQDRAKASSGGEPTLARGRSAADRVRGARASRSR